MDESYWAAFARRASGLQVAFGAVGVAQGDWAGGVLASNQESLVSLRLLEPTYHRARPRAPSFLHSGTIAAFACSWTD